MTLAQLTDINTLLNEYTPISKDKLSIRDADVLTLANIIAIELDQSGYNELPGKDSLEKAELLKQKWDER